MSLPEHPRLYVIGDIHGRLDLLERLIAAIRQDAGPSGAESLTVTLGDYIDRGPDSRGVVERLAVNPFPGRYVALKGNHEALLEIFLRTPAIFEQWRTLGGLETLHSFGVPVGPLMRGRDYERAAQELRAALSLKHRKFFRSLGLSVMIGRYFLCHAGVRPGVPLDQQSEEDLLWIRDDFLSSQARYDKIIVHGHSPVPEPEVHTNRINIDTGAFATGRLTCLVLEEGTYRYIAT